MTKEPMKPALAAALAIVAGGIANIFFASGLGMTKVWVWLATVAMATILCACIGKAIADRWAGVLIDGRNRISLSRVQMLAWTLLVLSGLITAVSSNLAVAGGTAAFAIDIQDELLAAMGIAAASLAAAPALLTLKAGSSQAAVATNTAVDDAGWLDMFRGDEDSNQDRPDLSKIQQFLITLALVGGYCVALGDQFHDMAAGSLFSAFPPLDPKFIWLLGISHAGYLTYKAAPKPAAPPAPPA